MDNTKPWYMYPVSVPFGNTNYDPALGGSHDLDIGTPPNTPVTTLLPGTIETITSPTWGKQIGVKLDAPYNTIPFMAYLHLSAVLPTLHTGEHINVGDLLGWSGGCNTPDQYAGTSNPTGQNFLNTPDQSSLPQTGIALMRGPEYGTAGWENFPPIDWALDPTPILTAARAKYEQPPPAPQNLYTYTQEEIDTWNLSGLGLSMQTGIAMSWSRAWRSYPHCVFGPPMFPEMRMTRPDGLVVIVQEYLHGRCEDIAGSHAWYDGTGFIGIF